jgi:acetyl-CoA synthetase
MVERTLPEWFEPDRWVPPPGTVEVRRVARFMRIHGLTDYQSFLDRAVADPAWFYQSAFEDLGLEWPVPYHTIYDDREGVPSTRWFVGGRTNFAYMAVERWRTAGHKDRVALAWESDDGISLQLTYEQLGQLVERASAGLRALGVEKGDVVALYVPMIPEAAISLLAIARIGAIAAPAFSGYAADALAERLNIARAKVLITADGAMRHGVKIDLKAHADAAVEMAPSIERVIIIARLKQAVPMNPGRDLSWNALLDYGRDQPCEMFDADTPWLLAFTSGSSGRPKGAVHTHGGLAYRVAIELAYNFDMNADDRLLWITDMGWIMGPLNIAGVLSLGASLVMFEGSPDFPVPDRLWQVVDRYQITHLGFSPTLVRVLSDYGLEWVDRHDLNSLRILGSTGEPWTASSWRWLHRYVGRGKVPIINWSGGTEIGSGILAGSPVVPMKECRFAGPAPGIAADVYDAEGNPLVGEVGELVVTHPWPSMTRGLWMEPERYLETYWSRWLGVWFHGDRAIRYEDGSWELLGRSDDVLKVAGRRLGPVEVESVATDSDEIMMAAAVGIPDPVRGEAVALVIVPSLDAKNVKTNVLAHSIADRVARVLGKPFRPAVVLVVDDLPLSRSGKVHRRAVRAWLTGTDPGDLSTVSNLESREAIIAAKEHLGEYYKQTRKPNATNPDAASTRTTENPE